MMHNPFDLGRNMMEAWEKSMAEMLEKLTHDEAFVKQMSQSLTGGLDLRRQMQAHIEEQMKALNLPTRGDLERLSGYLQRIEQRQLDLEDRLEAWLARPVTPGAVRPPRPGARKAAAVPRRGARRG